MCLLAAQQAVGEVADVAAERAARDTSNEWCEHVGAVWTLAMNDIRHRRQRVVQVDSLSTRTRLGIKQAQSEFKIHQLATERTR